MDSEQIINVANNILGKSICCIRISVYLLLIYLQVRNIYLKHCLLTDYLRLSGGLKYRENER